MFNEPRTWKWMLPASFGLLFGLAGLYLSNADLGWMRSVATLCLGLTAICLVAAFGNLAVYYASHAADILYTRRKAMSLSADARILENVKGVHPDTIRLVFGERQRAWMRHARIELPDDIEPYSVLYARPSVTEHFFWHFLESSNNYRCMPKRALSDNSYSFDPLHKSTDREQYDQLIGLLQQRNILTKESASNGTPLWIPPWRPQLVAEDFGFEWDEEDEARLHTLTNLEGA